MHIMWEEESTEDKLERMIGRANKLEVEAELLEKEIEKLKKEKSELEEKASTLKRALLEVTLLL